MSNEEKRAALKQARDLIRNLFEDGRHTPGKGKHRCHICQGVDDRIGECPIYRASVALFDAELWCRP